MDHTFLADDHLALNETTFTWPDRIMPIIKMRYIYLQPVLANSVSLPFLVCNHVTWRLRWWSIYKLLEKCRNVDKLGTGDFSLKVTLFAEEYDTTMIKCLCVCFIQ